MAEPFFFNELSFFDDGKFYRSERTNEDIEAAQRFKGFVHKVMELHQISPIKKFTLLCGNTYDNSDLNKWVSYALRKGVQELHYELAGGIDSGPECFSMCETLVNLKIIGTIGRNIKFPMSVWLPNLRILHLQGIVFVDNNSSARLFSSCKLLRELALVCCHCDIGGHDIALHTRILKVLTVIGCSFKRDECTQHHSKNLLLCISQAPQVKPPIDAVSTWHISMNPSWKNSCNLAYLKYTSNIGVRIVPSWKNSCSSTYDDADEDSYIYERELLNAAAYKATRLCLGLHSIELFFKLDEEQHIPDFRSSSSVRASNCPLHTWEYVTSLIDKSTQLETLVFQTCFFGCRNCEEGAYLPKDCYCDSWSPSDIPLPPFSCSVEVIEVHKFCGVDPYSFLLMEHLLANAGHLKRMIVHIRRTYRSYTYNDDDDDDDDVVVVEEDDDDDLERDLEISKRLLMLPRASVDCQLEIEFCSGNTAVISRPNGR